jgi:hypothetical protein
MLGNRLLAFKFGAREALAVTVCIHGLYSKALKGPSLRWLLDAVNLSSSGPTLKDLLFEPIWIFES